VAWSLTSTRLLAGNVPALVMFNAETLAPFESSVSFATPPTTKPNSVGSP
jgi:hypothetical protein